MKGFAAETSPPAAPCHDCLPTPPARPSSHHLHVEVQGQWLQGLRGLQRLRGQEADGQTPVGQKPAVPREPAPPQEPAELPCLQRAL